MIHPRLRAAIKRGENPPTALHWHLFLEAIDLEAEEREAHDKPVRPRAHKPEGPCTE